MPGGNLAGDPQAQAGSYMLLGSKEGFKDAPPVLRWHPSSLVCNQNAQARHLGFGMADGVEGKRDGGVLGRSVNGIREQVSKHLADLPSATLH